MLSLCTSAAMYVAAATHPDPHLQALLALRLAQLDPADGTDLGDLVHIFVFEPGDTLEELTATLGFNPLQGDQEAIQQHDGWFEVVWIFSDWGDGAILFVSQAKGVAPRLTTFCSDHAKD